MPRITLTDLIDVVAKLGSPKATKVAQIKNRPAYEPAADFYKIFRNGVIELHKKGDDKAALKAISTKTSDPKRTTHYAAMISGYTKWWGRKSITWFAPPSTVYSNSGIEVSINPELGLHISEQSYIVKLYMKSDALTKTRADLITALMESTLRDKTKMPAAMAVLDVKNGKLFEFSTSDKKFKPMIDAELAYIANIWPHL